MLNVLGPIFKVLTSDGVLFVREYRDHSRPLSKRDWDLDARRSWDEVWTKTSGWVREGEPGDRWRLFCDIAWHVPIDRLRTIALGLFTPANLIAFGVDLDQVQLHAEDIAWSAGTGAPVIGAGIDIVMAVFGRHLPQAAFAVHSGSTLAALEAARGGASIAVGPPGAYRATLWLDDAAADALIASPARPPARNRPSNPGLPAPNPMTAMAATLPCPHPAITRSAVKNRTPPGRRAVPARRRGTSRPGSGAARALRPRPRRGT